MIVGSSPVSDKYIFLAFLVHYSQYFVLFYSSKIDLKAFRRKQEFLRTKDREISLCTGGATSFLLSSKSEMRLGIRTSLYCNELLSCAKKRYLAIATAC